MKSQKKIQSRLVVKTLTLRSLSSAGGGGLAKVKCPPDALTIRNPWSSELAG